MSRLIVIVLACAALSSITSMKAEIEFKENKVWKNMNSHYGALIYPVWDIMFDEPGIAIRPSINPKSMTKFGDELVKLKKESDKFNLNIIYVPIDNKHEAIFLGVLIENNHGIKSVALFDFEQKEKDFVLKCIKSYRKNTKTNLKSPSK